MGANRVHPCRQRRQIRGGRRIAELLHTQSDEQLIAIKPFEVARAWRAEPREVVRGFLHASRAGLFDSARIYLCRSQHTRGDALVLAQELWQVLGARPEEISADAHDRLLAYASHLPQAVATALALALDGAGVSRAALGPGGRDVTRLAGGSVDMWTAIARDNADALLPAIGALETQLQRLKAAFSAGDETAIRDLFGGARAWSTADGAGQ